MSDEKLPEYTWWDQVPDNLKTKTQLGEMNLVPVAKERALISYGRGRKARCYSLYNVAETRPKNEPSPAQLEALEKGRQKQDEKRRTCCSCHEVKANHSQLDNHNVCWDCYQKAEKERDDEAHDEAVQWARALLARTDWLILDFETTDLSGYAVEVAILHPDGRCLFSSRINPLHPISEGARAVHGISDDDVRDMPTFAQLEAQLFDIVRGHTLVAYNASFDSSILANELYRLKDKEPAWVKGSEWEDAMQPYSDFCGEWSEYRQSYKWQRLGGDHGAEGDCRACLRIIQRMAAMPLSDEQFEPTP